MGSKKTRAPDIDATLTGDVTLSGDATLAGDATLDGRRLGPRRAPPPELFHLLVFHENSSHLVQLPPSGEIIIGRGSSADVALDDASASRRHAKLTLANHQATIEDLGSRNGTQVNGDRLRKPRPLTAGDVITICDVTLVYNATAQRKASREVVALEQLHQRGAEEIERSLRYQRPLTVLSALFGPKAPPSESLAMVVLSELRLMDVVAWGDPGELVVLLPETSATEAPGSAETILRAVRALGARPRLGFSTCPEDGCELDTLLASARAAAQAAPEGQVAAAAEATGTLEVGGLTIVVADPAMARLYALVERLAATDIAVLIHGETGTGKEVIATALHHLSARGRRSLVSLNCAALHETLLESELFGHQKGAFSGAVATKPGLLETAGGGTLLLDEIGELSPTAQAKLLRVLETKRVIRLGDVRERQIDIRIVAATNRNLQDDVQAGRFRQDLFFRLSAATVWLPPLRSRKRDLPLLAQTFLREACAKAEREPMSLSAAAMQCITTYAWPGNVRELKHLMEYVVATVSEQLVQPRHLGPVGDGAPSMPSHGELPGAPLGARPISDDGGPEAEITADGTPAFRPLEEEVRELERNRMVEALQATEGNQTRAAQLIKMPLRTFASKLKQYRIPKLGKRRR